MEVKPVLKVFSVTPKGPSMETSAIFGTNGCSNWIGMNAKC